MDKPRRKEARGSKRDELHALGFSHFKGAKIQLFHHKIMKIKSHGGLSLFGTNLVSQRTPKLKLV
jgi:hypothetical protein